VPDFKHFKLPDVGEGLTEAEILRWYVQPGDVVTINQIVVEIETAKAAVELPSPYAGRVSELHVAEGSTVDVGTPIITVDIDPDGAPPGQVEAPPVTLRDDLVPQLPLPDEAIEPGIIGGPAPGGRTSVLVGYGPRSVAAKRRPRKPPAGTGPAGEAGTKPIAAPISATPAPVGRSSPTAAPAGSAGATGPAGPTGSAGPAGPTGSAGRTVGPAGPTGRTAGPAPDLVVLAKPPVRKLAKDLGVDLRAVAGSGPNGVITRSDVESAARPVEAELNGAVRTVPAPVWDASREQRVPIKGVRKHIAAAMVSSAFTAPHVTEFVSVDVTPMMELRQRVAATPEFHGVKVSPLLFVAKALLLAVRRHPMMNSSWDEPAQEIVVKEYVNLGIAAATARGLIVPNIKDAGRLPLRELAVALAELTGTARAGRTTPADMSGGTITITNVGVFGIDTGTPIINPGEAAILALGSVREMPWVVDGQLAVRQVAQLSVSFDHRIIDGQLGAEFLADIATLLSDPARALAWS